MASRDAWRSARSTCGALAFVLVCATGWAEDPNTLHEGAVITLTRDAVVNGVTLPKGSLLKVSSVRKDVAGAVRVDLEQLGGTHQTFKSVTRDALAQLAGAGNLAVPNVDPGQMLKVGAQITLVRDVLLKELGFAKGTVLSVDKVTRDAKGKVVKVDLREISGKSCLVRGVAVDQLLLGLAADAVTWPDGAVGARLQLPRELQLGDATFPKGTKFVVTHVVYAVSGGGVVKVNLREAEGQKRPVPDVPVAVLKQAGAIVTGGEPPK